jgi:hypothetical protein
MGYCGTQTCTSIDSHRPRAQHPSSERSTDPTRRGHTDRELTAAWVAKVCLHRNHGLRESVAGVASAVVCAEFSSVVGPGSVGVAAAKFRKSRLLRWVEPTVHRTIAWCSTAIDPVSERRGTTAPFGLCMMLANPCLHLLRRALPRILAATSRNLDS